MTQSYNTVRLAGYATEDIAVCYISGYLGFIISLCFNHCTKKPVTTMLTYPWKCTVLHCNHLGNTWKPLVLMTQHFDYCPSDSKGDNQSVRSSAVVLCARIGGFVATRFHPIKHCRSSIRAIL